MITNNGSFSKFLENKDERYYAERTKDYNNFLFKIPYDGDCDFIHILRTYISRYNPDGKPGLNDKSELGGIYIYSSGLLFNTEYCLREFLNCTDTVAAGYKATDVKECYKQLCRSISAEIACRIEAGRFDRDGAAKLVGEDDRDIKYAKEYRERGFAENDFMDGKRLDKPVIHISYDTRCDYDIAAVLEYLRSPEEIINARADVYMEAEKAMIYKQIVRAEVQFESFKEIEQNKYDPLHYRREIRRVTQSAGAKTVNVALERNGQRIMVKTDAERLGWNNDISDWNIAAADRPAYKEVFGHKHGGDARMDEITLVTHGKKELYNKSAFDKILFQGVRQ